MIDDDTFEIPVHPHRIDLGHGFTFEGHTDFRLAPASDDTITDADLHGAVELVLEADLYVYGEGWNDGYWYVFDQGAEATFDVAIEPGSGVMVFVKVGTTPAAVEAFHDRLADELDADLAVDRDSFRNLPADAIDEGDRWRPDA